MNPYGWYGESSECPSDCSDEDTWYDNHYENRRERGIDLPDFPAFVAPPDQPVDLTNSKLQVIVKLANIHLTPEAPEYEGGVRGWGFE